jgi:hypothetical protein
MTEISPVYPPFEGCAPSKLDLFLVQTGGIQEDPAEKKSRRETLLRNNKERRKGE